MNQNLPASTASHIAAGAIPAPAASGPTPEARAAWRRAWLPMVLVLAAILFLYRDTALAMTTIWARSETFTHCFLVPPIVLWLIWRQRADLGALAPRPSAWALLPLAGAAGMWLLGDLAAVNSVTQTAFVALLVLAVPAVLGWHVARAMMFPLGFLFFAVPLGEFLMPQLMEWTADFTVVALRASGIPVYREGLNFIIPSGSWSVVEACSGVRYLIASLTVGTLFAYLNYQSNRRRWIFVGVSILVPVIANWLRAYLIVMLGHLSGNKLAVGVDHLIYGWLFFGVVIMLMFMAGARWAENAPAPGTGVQARGVSPMFANARAGWLITLLAAIAIAAPHAAEWGIDRADIHSPVQLAAPSKLADGWQLRQEPVSAWLPAFQSPSAQTSATYARNGKAVGLYVGYYRNQDYQRKLVSSDNMLVKSKDPSWDPVRGFGSVAPGDGLPAMRTAEVRAASSLLSSGVSERLAVWQVYWVNGRFTASDHVAKAYSAAYRLLGQGDESAVVIFFTPKELAGTAEAALQSFAGANLPAIDAWLRQTKAAP